MDNSDDKGRGKKRKKSGVGGDGTDSEHDDEHDKSRPRIEYCPKEEVEKDTNKLICSCPRNVMTCIGILPSLPIVSQFCRDSDDSDSSIDEDLTFTVLPRVDRNALRGNNE